MTRKELIGACLGFENVYEDYPFGDDWTVMRHSKGKKSFAMIYERGGRLCVNLKCDPIKADFLRRVFKGVTPAYHMNKEHWNTVLPGSDVTKRDLLEMIGESYALTKPKIKKKRSYAASENT